jgi:hypothetical protein
MSKVLERKSKLYNENYGILAATAKALINKKQVPQHTLGLLTDPACLRAATMNYMSEPIKEYSCPNCLLTIKCPREWIRAHHKKCVSAHKIKENEMLTSKFNAYY